MEKRHESEAYDQPVLHGRHVGDGPCRGTKTTSITYSVIAGAGTSTSCGFAVVTGDGRSFDLYLSSSGKTGKFVAISGLVTVGFTTVGITGIEGQIEQE